MKGGGGGGGGGVLGVFFFWLENSEGGWSSLKNLLLSVNDGSELAGK